MGWFGDSSLVIFMSVFGGSTLLLFLICFCCQKKLQARTLAMAGITDIEIGRPTQVSRQPRRSDAHQLLIPSVLQPPPDYNSALDYAAVVKKNSNDIALNNLPTYEAAVAGLKANGHI